MRRFTVTDIRAFNHLFQTPKKTLKLHSRKIHNNFLQMLIVIVMVATIGHAFATTQRSLNADVIAEYPIFIQFEGQTHSIDVPSHGTIKDIESALSRVTQMDNAQFSLQSAGRILGDYTVSIADAGICAESMIEAVLMNDLQIFDKMLHRRCRDQVWRGHTRGQFSSYQDAYTASNGGDVMQLFAEIPGHGLNGQLNQINEGRITKFNVNLQCMNVNELWRLKGLTNLKTLDFMHYSGHAAVSKLDLSGLSYLKNLDWLGFHNVRGLKELILPNWEASTLTAISITACPDLRIMDARTLGYRGRNLTIQVDKLSFLIDVRCGDID